jgi:hypothetical protein
LTSKRARSLWAVSAMIPTNPGCSIVARNQTDCFDGFLNDKRYLFHRLGGLLKSYRRVRAFFGPFCRPRRAATGFGGIGIMTPR